MEVYRNVVTGVEGVFIKRFTNFYGETVMVRTLSGRKYYAPLGEWKKINNVKQ